MKQPTPSMNEALAAGIVLAALLGGSHAVDEALVAATCKAAAASDKRVNLQLCMSRLGNNTASNTWGLAQVAADACISSNIVFSDDLVALTVQLEAGNKELKPLVEALAQCNPACSYAREAFDEAKKQIKERVYATAMKQLDEGSSWTQKCKVGLTVVEGAKMPEPLGQHTSENIQLAIIAKAITSLIK